MTPAIQNSSNAKDTAKKSAFPKEMIKAAFAEGNALVKDGKPKVDAARRCVPSRKAPIVRP